MSLRHSGLSLKSFLSMHALVSGLQCDGISNALLERVPDDARLTGDGVLIYSDDSSVDVDG